MSLLLCLALLDGDPPRAVAKAVEDKVREVLAREFVGHAVEKGVPRVAAAIARVPDAAWRARLLADLPDAARYHRLALGGFEEGGGATIPKESWAEGVDLHLGYLAAVVERAAKRKRDPETRRAVEAQIDRVWGAAAEAVGDRLGGPVPAATKGKLDGLARAWKEGFDRPYQSCLDRPIGEDELREVLAGLKAAGATSASEPELVDSVREAAYRAMQRCFREYEPFEKAARAWDEKRERLFDDARRAAAK